MVGAVAAQVEGVGICMAGLSVQFEATVIFTSRNLAQCLSSTYVAWLPSNARSVRHPNYPSPNPNLITCRAAANWSVSPYPSLKRASTSSSSEASSYTTTTTTTQLTCNAASPTPIPSLLSLQCRQPPPPPPLSPPAPPHTHTTSSRSPLGRYLQCCCKLVGLSVAQFEEG